MKIKVLGGLEGGLEDYGLGLRIILIMEIGPK